MTFAAVSKRQRDEKWRQRRWNKSDELPSLPEGRFSMEQSSEFTSWNSSRWFEKGTYTPTLQKVTYELIRTCCFQSIYPTQGKPPPQLHLKTNPCCWVLFQLGFTCCFPGDSVTLSLCQGISSCVDLCFYVERSESLKNRCNRYTPKKNIMNKRSLWKGNHVSIFWKETTLIWTNHPFF